MGLDGVELVMEVERRFGITIKDGEAQQIRTVGDLARLIDDRMAGKTRSACPTMEGFLAVRRLIRQFLTSPDFRLRPSMQIASVVPAHSRRRFWRRVRTQLGVPLPPLEQTQGTRLLLTTIYVGLIAMGVSTALIDPAILPLGVVFASLCMLGIHWIMGWWRTEVPASIATVGQLSQRVAGLSVAIAPPLSSREVFERLREIIVDQLGVRPDEVVMDARFVEDLGLS